MIIARNEELCIHLLSRTSWNVDSATNEFFDNGWKYPDDKSKVSEKSLKKDF